MILSRVGVPVYLQVKAKIEEKIKNGEYGPGMKLPTERALAEELGISRNTVSAAYKELLLEGVLEARQGRGTFVRGAAAADEQDLPGSRRQRAVKIIDAALKQVLELGFSAEQFAAIASLRVQEKLGAVKALRVAVVDHAAEFASQYVRQIGQIANVQFETIALADLHAGRVRREFLDSCDLVITTTKHKAEVSAFWGQDKKLLVVSAVPNMEAMLKLARLPVGSRIGAVAESAAFAEALRKLSQTVTLNALQVDAAPVEDLQALRQFAEQHAVLVTSVERERMTRQAAQAGQEIIVFYYELDQGSLAQAVAGILNKTN